MTDSSTTAPGQPQAPPAPPPESTTESRQDILSRAQAFLTSPQIRDQDDAAKREFLTKKGLAPAEVDSLLQGIPYRIPGVPPRSYPQPPPSNLPALLVGVFRILTWLAGGSVAMILVYFRYLLPRLTASLQARISLQSHQLDLVGRLHSSVESLRATQEETFSVLPTAKPPGSREDSAFTGCLTLEELGTKIESERIGVETVPHFTLLRCALASGKLDKPPTTEELFKNIEAHLPRLSLASSAELQDQLWETLNTYPSYFKPSPEETPTWTYGSPDRPPPTQYLASLESLSKSLPPNVEPPSSKETASAGAKQSWKPKYQHMLQTLTDLTGYLTTQTYLLPSGGSSGYNGIGYTTSSTLATPQQEEIRKEIRALKGLALSRRTFAIPKVSSVANVHQQ
ncbi:hypothetical protein BJ322DRAFT_352187 [Thelephora terrestris]|uniref:Peroxisomal membrane protein PEX14 n=1 Tax=Thelephora terrestris TaxID=56493 RepID=A0A9P6H6A5_9AGAM|nr:hypothetical protein BJ322DRAFT_352187 [Thelephora terrestris]